MNLDRKLREINIEEWMGEGFNVKRLNEQNFADAREKIFEDISLNTYNNFMTLVERGMRALGVQVDKQPGEAFDINKLYVYNPALFFRVMSYVLFCYIHDIVEVDLNEF